MKASLYGIMECYIYQPYKHYVDGCIVVCASRSRNTWFNEDEQVSL